jgi:tetratricopeptide (TPR) repeat protein
LFETDESIMTPAAMTKNASKRVISCNDSARLFIAFEMGCGFQMDAQGGSATDVPVNAAGRREAKIVAAARVLSIDYRPIIEDAVTNLTDNNPDKRSKVYAQARGVVKRHLQLMRLPEPIVELEKLALDVTIGEIERRCHAREAAEKAIPQDPPERRIESNAAAKTLGLRPAITATLIIARLLRPLAHPIGVAVALPTIAAIIFFGLYVGDKVTYRILVDSPAGRWFSGLNVKPDATTRITADAGRVTTDLGPTRVGPIRAEFTVPSNVPQTATMSAACGSGPSISERNACTHDTGRASTEPQTQKSDTEPPWLAGFAALMDITSGRAPSSISPSGSMSPGDGAARDAAPNGVPEPREAAPVMSSNAASDATAAQADRTALVKPINAKVAALIESGKRATLKGDLDRAVRDFSEAIRIDPEYPDSYLERGQVLFKLGEIERAIADYSAALVRDPQQGAALRARGMAYLYNSKADLALADLSKTIELAESNPRLLAPIELFYARRSRGAIYDSKQQYDREIADCTALIESYTHDPRLVEALTANYGNAAAANILATIYRQRANAFIKRSNWERAVADLTEAIPLSSDRGYTALIDRSKLQEGLGRYQSAAADAQAALNIRPGSEEARLALNRLGTPSKPTPPKGL